MLRARLVAMDSHCTSGTRWWMKKFGSYRPISVSVNTSTADDDPSIAVLDATGSAFEEQVHFVFVIGPPGDGMWKACTTDQRIFPAAQQALVERMGLHPDRCIFEQVRHVQNKPFQCLVRVVGFRHNDETYEFRSFIDGLNGLQTVGTTTNSIFAQHDGEGTKMRRLRELLQECGCQSSPKCTLLNANVHSQPAKPQVTIAHPGLGPATVDGVLSTVATTNGHLAAHQEFGRGLELNPALQEPFIPDEELSSKLASYQLTPNLTNAQEFQLYMEDLHWIFCRLKTKYFQNGFPPDAARAACDWSQDAEPHSSIQFLRCCVHNLVFFLRTILGHKRLKWQNVGYVQDYKENNRIYLVVKRNNDKEAGRFELPPGGSGPLVFRYPSLRPAIDTYVGRKDGRKDSTLIVIDDPSDEHVVFEIGQVSDSDTSINLRQQSSKVCIDPKDPQMKLKLSDDPGAESATLSLENYWDVMSLSTDAHSLPAPDPGAQQNAALAHPDKAIAWNVKESTYILDCIRYIGSFESDLNTDTMLPATEGLVCWPDALFDVKNTTALRGWMLVIHIGGLDVIAEVAMRVLRAFSMEVNVDAGKMTLLKSALSVFVEALEWTANKRVESKRLLATFAERMGMKERSSEFWRNKTTKELITKVLDMLGKVKAEAWMRHQCAFLLVRLLKLDCCDIKRPRSHQQHSNQKPYVLTVLGNAVQGIKCLVELGGTTDKQHQDNYRVAVQRLAEVGHMIAQQDFLAKLRDEIAWQRGYEELGARRDSIEEVLTCRPDFGIKDILKVIAKVVQEMRQ